VSPKDNLLAGAVDTAKQLAAALERENCEYALGGAIALGFWGEPRGTLDVDVTLFPSPNQPSNCVRTLQIIGCDVATDAALQSLAEHGFCQVSFGGRRIDVFRPIVPFYEQARQRRKCVPLDEQLVFIWDAETLCVFKMMFFRRKDIADVEQILRVQSNRLDCEWISQKLIELYGQRDPRVAQWRELVTEINKSARDA
jgi:hypothetical protein